MNQLKPTGTSLGTYDFIGKSGKKYTFDFDHLNYILDKEIKGAVYLVIKPQFKAIPKGGLIEQSLIYSYIDQTNDIKKITETNEYIRHLISRIGINEVVLAVYPENKQKIRSDIVKDLK